MAGCALDAVEHLVEAFDALPGRRTAASEHADAAIKAVRGLEKAYRQAIADLAVSTDPPGRVVLTAEIYRRYDGLGDARPRRLVLGVEGGVAQPTRSRARD
jgi:hypothetical protein